MSKFYFDVRSRGGLLLDPEGLDFNDSVAALKACLLVARDLVGQDVKHGTLDLAQWIVVKDQGGRVVHEVPLAAALSFQRMEDAGLAKACPVLNAWRDNYPTHAARESAHAASHDASSACTDAAAAKDGTDVPRTYN